MNSFLLIYLFVFQKRHAREPCETQDMQNDDLTERIVSKNNVNTSIDFIHYFAKTTSSKYGHSNYSWEETNQSKLANESTANQVKVKDYKTQIMRQIRDQFAQNHLKRKREKSFEVFLNEKEHSKYFERKTKSDFDG